MTCIIGIVDKGNIYMGGDSAGVSGLSITIRSDEKVFINGPFLLGFTSSFRMGQLLRYKFSVAKQTTNETDVQYMTTTFIDAVRKCFADNGFGDKDKGGTFLVGYNSTLYTIDSDFQVGIPRDQYDAVGCGCELALGSLHTTRGKKPEERITKALEAASYFNAGVAPPFIMLKQIAKKK